MFPHRRAISLYAQKLTSVNAQQIDGSAWYTLGLVIYRHKPFVL